MQQKEYITDLGEFLISDPVMEQIKAMTLKPTAEEALELFIEGCSRAQFWPQDIIDTLEQQVD